MGRWAPPPAAHHAIHAPADRTPRVGQRLQPARALRDHHAEGTLHAVLDRDLPGGGGVEPRDRLVGADELRPFSHSAWISRCPNSLPPEELAVITLIEQGRARSDRTGVVERHLGGSERHPRPAVGLLDQALVDVSSGSKTSTSPASSPGGARDRSARCARCRCCRRASPATRTRGPGRWGRRRRCRVITAATVWRSGSWGSFPHSPALRRSPGTEKIIAD